MNLVALRGRGACPFLFQQCRRAGGLAAQDASQVLGTCGVQPYSEAFIKNVQMQDELSEQLSAGGQGAKQHKKKRGAAAAPPTVCLPQTCHFAFSQSALQTSLMC